VTPPLLVAALVAFAATTVDDLVIVTALFTTGRTTGRPRPATIIAGQFVGFGAIIGVSLAAAAGLQAVPDRWVGLLGFVPIGFGTWGCGSCAAVPKTLTRPSHQASPASPRSPSPTALTTSACSPHCSAACTSPARC
jgi:hypothetical protein